MTAAVFYFPALLRAIQPSKAHTAITPTTTNRTKASPSPTPKAYPAAAGSKRNDNTSNSPGRANKESIHDFGMGGVCSRSAVIKILF